MCSSLMGAVGWFAGEDSDVAGLVVGRRGC